LVPSSKKKKKRKEKKKKRKKHVTSLFRGCQLNGVLAALRWFLLSTVPFQNI